MKKVIGNQIKAGNILIDTYNKTKTRIIRLLPSDSKTVLATAMKKYHGESFYRSPVEIHFSPLGIFFKL